MPGNILEIDDAEVAEDLKIKLTEIENLAKELRTQSHYEKRIDLDRLEELVDYVDEVAQLVDAEDDDDDD